MLISDPTPVMGILRLHAVIKISIPTAILLFLLFTSIALPPQPFVFHSYLRYNKHQLIKYLSDLNRTPIDYITFQEGKL